MLYIRAVVTVTDTEALARVFNRSHPAPKHLGRYLGRKRRCVWYFDKSRGLAAGFSEDHPGPDLPLFPNAVVQIGGRALLRHGGDYVGAWEGVVALFASAGLQIVDHQLSSLDLALDFAEWGVARADSLLSRVRAAREQDRILTRANILPPRCDWGIKISSRDFAGNVYDLTRRLTMDERDEYERHVHETAPTPSEGVLTRVELTARREILHESGVERLSDLDNALKRRKLVGSFRRRMRIVHAEEQRKNDPEWTRVLGVLRWWSQHTPRAVRDTEARALGQPSRLFAR